MQENYRILSILWSFDLAFFKLQYAMDVDWKTIGIKEMQKKNRNY